MSSKIANRLQTFYSSVCKTPFCWNWMGPLDDEGYAWTDIPRQPMRAIEFLYKAMHQSLPLTKRIGLTCYNRLCVNPGHIEAWDRPTPLAVTDEEGRSISMERRSLDPEVRFWSWVTKDGPIPSFKTELGPCWLWTGGVTGKGYGSFLLYKKQMLVHRVSYLLEYGDLPDDDLEIDHLCRNKLCVNPKHLETVTHQENMERSVPYRKKQYKTHELENHCKHGHEYTEENTIYFTDKKYGRQRRTCRQCYNARNRSYRLKTYAASK